MKRRNISLLFVTLLLAFSLMGCGTSQKASDKPAEEIKTAEESTPKVNTEEKEDETVQTPVTTNSEKAEEKTEIKTPVTQEKTQLQTATKQSTNKTVTAKSSSTSTTKTTTTTTSTTTSQTAATKKTEPQTTITFSIKGPKDVGTIVGATKVAFKDGDTVFDIIRSVAKKKGIVVDSTGSGAAVYIAGIDNIYEFDYGVKSGWVFKQNGVNLTKSVGVTKVKDGDQIECYYTE